MQPEQPECSLPKLPNATTYHGKLALFTPFYDYRGHAPYLTSMISTVMMIERLGIEWDYFHIYGDFHFDRALNKALTDFMRSDFTDMILVDSDLKWSPEGMLRLLFHDDVEVVAGSYRRKNAWHSYVGEYTTGERGIPRGIFAKDGLPLLEASRIPGGFTRFRKSALQKYADAYPEMHYADGDSTSVAFFYAGIQNNEFFSHDYLLSEKWKAIGVNLWLDPNITLTHYGTVGYEGNLQKHLVEGGKLNDAIKVVNDMAVEIAKRTGT